MNPILTLLPDAGAVADSNADVRIAAAASAIATGETHGLPDTDAACVARMRQAIEKIDSGAQVQRIAEVITLAQFGAASAGTLVSRACDDPEAAARCEASHIGYFLIGIAAQRDTLAHLIPAAPSGADDSRADAVEEIMQRAADALRVPGTIRHPGLRRYIAFRSALSGRQIAKMRRYGAGDRRAVLTGWDRMVVRLRLFLRVAPGS